MNCTRELQDRSKLEASVSNALLCSLGLSARSQPVDAAGNNAGRHLLMQDNIREIETLLEFTEAI